MIVNYLYLQYGRFVLRLQQKKHKNVKKKALFKLKAAFKHPGQNFTRLLKRAGM